MEYFSKVYFLTLIINFVEGGCEKRFVHYLTVYGKSNSSRTYSLSEAKNLFRCCVLCTENQFCVEFLYNSLNRQCLQLFFSEREDNSYTDQTPQTGLDFVHFRKSCKPPWTEYNHHCYLKGQTEVTWAEAKAECEDMCSHLVVIDNMEESNWLAKAFLRKNNCPTDIFADCTAWTGGNDLEVEGQYRWNNSNVTMIFTYWSPNEPSLSKPSAAYTRDCIDLLKTAKWNDRPCSYLNSFICEKSY